MSKIEIIGLGTVGKPMAGHLLAGSHQLFPHDVKLLPAELARCGGHACASGRDVAQQADIVIAMEAWDHSALVRALEIMANVEIGGTVTQ